MRYAGIDIGSRSIELAVIQNGRIIARKICDAGFDPLAQSEALLEGVEYDRLMATGYGRHLLEISRDIPTITEIKAYAEGAKYFYPEARTIIDIGGQDCKVIALNENGKVRKFEMNDRCAAGTGKFLEVMAKTLGYSIEKFGYEALKATDEVKISSMCTVFGESEVISLLARGADRQQIALGLHKSVVGRIQGMFSRVSGSDPILFAGGVAENQCIVQLLKDGLRKEIFVPENPQFTGAIGSAIIAWKG